MVRRLALLACLSLPIACAKSGDGATSNAGGKPTVSSSGDSGASGDDAGNVLPDPGSDDAGGGGDDDAAMPGEEAGPIGVVALPFYVSDQFVPSGFMGDSQTSISAITLSHEASQCKAPRLSGAGGDCYSITWTASPPDGGSSWSGVYWQSPSDNWGAKPGKAIAAGATKVSFLAAGAVGGEVIQACAGGIANPSLPHGDTFSVKSPSITLTKDWTRYEISLQGASYTDVLGGFCWVTSSTASASITFYVDDLRWE